MPYCPKCRSEFQDWVKVCIDCNVDLVDDLPELPPKLKPKAPERLVKIATFSHAIEAHLHRTKLESEGIHSFVTDEYMVTTQWLYSTALGGVKLWVRESDVEKAQQILKSIPKQNPESGVTNNGDELCPRCGSPDIHYETFNLRPLFISWIIIGLFFSPTVQGSIGGFPLPFTKKKWKCKNCGHEWQKTMKSSDV